MLPVKIVLYYFTHIYSVKECKLIQYFQLEDHEYCYTGVSIVQDDSFTHTNVTPNLAF